MSRVTVLAIVFSLIMASNATAKGRIIKSLKFENKTSPELSLSFAPQKVKWKYEKIRIWAAVENTGSVPYEFVAVSFTALDKDRKFLGRQKVYVDPSDLAGGEVGNLDDAFIDTEERIPAIIQYKIIGDED